MDVFKKEKENVRNSNAMSSKFVWAKANKQLVN